MTSVPGRVCMAGEDLDWMVGGSSVVAAIPLRTRVKIWKSDLINSLILSSAPPLARTYQVRHHTFHRYTRTPLEHMHSAARETAASNWENLAGLMLRASTEIPIGAGVASSAAITLATAAAVDLSMRGERASVEAVCKLAYQAESIELGVGSGWMDFLACGFGGVNHILASMSPQLTVLAPSLTTTIVLVDTMERRDTRAVIDLKRERLTAGDQGISRYISLATEVVDELNKALMSSSWRCEEIGSLLNRAQYALREYLKCSTDLIDECVRRCLQGGAYGAKLTGSGHGGAMFAMAPPCAVDEILERLNEFPVYVTVLPDVDDSGLTVSVSEGS